MAKPTLTPASSEYVEDMGGAAPICPAPPPKSTSGPITLDVLQGEWYAGNGSKITVSGTMVYLNGLPLQHHSVEFREDGSVCGIGQLWQVDGWGADGSIQFSSGSKGGDMEFAPKEVWTRRGTGDAWSERMRILGYADPLNRGVEGCIPGTLAQDMAAPQDAQEIVLLQILISQWREPELQLVRPCRVVPDFTNREGTGIGVEHTHFVALSIREQGFKKRRGTVGHDIPVVVREPPNSVVHGDALKAWKKKVSEDEGFAPVRIAPEEEMFTSLGNGHFFQALNLYDCEWAAINGKGKYVVGQDKCLAEAISDGVPSIVLKHTTPRTVRAKISQVLNSKCEFHWNLQEDDEDDGANGGHGQWARQLSVDTAAPMEEDTSYHTQFESMSKVLDAVQLNCLVRTHLGIHDSTRSEA
jgi:hypothetical protein